MKQPIRLGPQALLWQDLGPKAPFLSNTLDSNHLILSWASFVEFAAKTLVPTYLAQASSFGFHLESWHLDRLEPSADELSQLQSLLAQVSLRHVDQLSSTKKISPITIHLLISNQCQIAPTLYCIDQANSFKVDSLNPSEFWEQPQAKLIFTKAIEFVLHHQLQVDTSHQKPLQILKKLKSELLEHSSAADWVLLFSSLLGQKNREGIATSLWAELVRLNELLLAQLQNTNWQPLTPNLFDLAHNPVSALCRSFEATPATGGVYSIGAGQMVSILDYTRQLMDQGLLPLTTPLIADNRAFAAVAELRLTGQRQALLNDLWINPEDRKPIAVHRDILREELIAKHQPAVVFLNVKAQAITTILSDEFCQFLANLPYTPTLVMPSKSYTAAGETPYQWVYRQLHQYSPTLAQQLVVLGGFYAAPSILTGDHVHLTIAAEQLAAAVKLAYHLCAVPPKDQGITITDGTLQLEIITGYPQSALLMAGGANKNFLTYTSARNLLQQAFRLDHTDQPTWLNTINSKIQHEARTNIQLSESIASQLLELHLSDQPTELPISSDGLKTDFIHCLPLSGQGICTLVEETYRLLRHLLRTPPAQRAALAAESLHKMMNQIRTDPHRLLGTRNARDGFIDELLLYFFYAWQEHKNRIPLTLDYARFYDQFYPSAWKGDGAQEGRNGILPVIVRASLLSDLKAVLWPSVLHEAWSLYCPAKPKFKAQGKFKQWHEYLFSLLEWIIEYCKDDPILIQQGLSRLSRWCYTTRAQSLEEVPHTLFELEKGLHEEGSLLEHCQRILRDCQYRDRQ